ncbi:hypothetical protein GHT06_022623 [Daphnia sinensis]|uniref:Uncharacterized protein n=1 Tax=Daphnia sinensis TaxID=1820382 RepID=A0AAD5KH95_9CRUS|nr:hypothetical protein GHT06_022623 [Daphnia sinensis]
MPSGSKRTFRGKGCHHRELDRASLQLAFFPSLNARSVMLCVCGGRFHQPQHPHCSC